MADTLWSALPTITGAGVADADTFGMYDASTDTVKQITAPETRKAISRTLYDATTGDPLFTADNGVLRIQDDVEFLSHGKLDTNSGFTPTGTDEGRLATWYDPQNTAWDQGGWFAFGFPHTGDYGVVQHWGIEDFEGANIRSLDTLTEFNLFARPGQTANIFSVWDENGDLTYWIPPGPISDSIYLYSDAPAVTGLTSGSPQAIPFPNTDANFRGDTIVDDGLGGFTAPPDARIIYHSDTFEFEFLQDGYAQAQASAFPDPRADGVFYVLIGSPAFLDANDTPTFLFTGSAVPLAVTTSPPNAGFVLFAGGSTLRVPVLAGDRWTVRGDMEAASGTTNVSFADVKIYWSGV